jgi:alkaline phosphatase D
VPSARSPLWTWTTVIINVVLALLTLDFLVRGFVLYPTTHATFARIGYVSPTTANLVFREPDLAQLPVVVSYQDTASQSPEKWVEEGIIYKLDNSTDFTATVTLKNLKPSTHYRYALSNNQSGTFLTAPKPGSPEAKRLSFVTSSCLKPNFPYNLLRHPLRVPGIEKMTEALAKLPTLLRPSFMLFLGDFIYIDVPLRFGISMSHYRSEYRRIYSSPSWNSGAPDHRAIDLPWIHTLDDHEIQNDWAKGNKTAPYPAAADPFIHYHVKGNPPVPKTPFAPSDNVTYFAFNHGPASFFMLDTRTYRTEPSHQNSTILGHAQLQSLLTYISTPEPPGTHWKIISSSVPFTKNWHVGTEDTWGGFTHERAKVFEAMWHAERTLNLRIILLSGDRHEFAATRFPDPALALPQSQLQPNTPGMGVHEFSVGPLSMFYLPIRTYRQTDYEDVMVKYVPDGNSKFGLIDIAEEVEDLVPGSSVPVPVRSSVLTYSLYVDGSVVWKYRLFVPLDRDEGSRASLSDYERALWLPPGRVVEDRVVDNWGAVVGDAVGRIPEVVKSVVEMGIGFYDDLTDRAQRA